MVLLNLKGREIMLKSAGRPKLAKKDIKKSHSIRLTDLRIKILKKRYGTLQKAFDAMIISDDEVWS